MIAQISSIEVEELISPGGKFAFRRRLVSEALRAQDSDDREAPFDIEFAQLPPGKRNYPHHSHATEWGRARAKKLCVSRRGASPCVPRALPIS